jgi:hypothetical protein
VQYSDPRPLAAANRPGRFRRPLTRRGHGQHKRQEQNDDFFKDSPNDKHNKKSDQKKKAGQRRKKLNAKKRNQQKKKQRGSAGKLNKNHKNFNGAHQGHVKDEENLFDDVDLDDVEEGLNRNSQDEAAFDGPDDDVQPASSSQQDQGGGLSSFFRTRLPALLFRGRGSRNNDQEEQLGPEFDLEANDDAFADRVGDKK